MLDANASTSVINYIKECCMAPAILTGNQIRAGRALLRWSARELAEIAGLSTITVQRLEGGGGAAKGNIESLRKVEEALQSAGVEFIEDGTASLEGGPGVRLKKEE